MRSFLTFVAVVALSACSVTPAAQEAISIACIVDGVLQPVAVTVAPFLAPELTPATTVDASLVHPVVVAACKAVNGIPAKVTVPDAAPAVPVVAPVMVAKAPGTV